MITLLAVVCLYDSAQRRAQLAQYAGDGKKTAAMDDNENSQGFYSVGELVRIQGSERDRWNLPIVQRGEVWDELHRRSLIDSLLAGYPIGSLLIVSVSIPSMGLTKEADGRRAPVSIETDRLLLLDGQQRLIGLSMALDRCGDELPRLFMDMSHPRPEAVLGRGKRQKSKSLVHLAWVEQGAEPEDREWKVDLSGFREWCEGEAPSSASGYLDVDGVSAENVVDLLRSFDPDFQEGSDRAPLPVLVENMKRLMRLWEYKVPVVHAAVDSPTSVLDLFTRVNMEGVRVTGPDVYLAAVRTHWHDADSHLDALVTGAPMLRNRLGALTFISRVVQNRRDAKDPLPLDANLLLGDEGEDLIEHLEEVAREDGDMARKLWEFTEFYRARGGLGWAAVLYRAELWQDVLGWVISGSGEQDLWKESLEYIDTYLLGSTLFSYHWVFGDKVHRRAFKECVEAGVAGGRFPLDEILALSHNPSELSFRRSRVLADASTQAGRDALLEAGGRPLVAFAQRIPFDGLRGGLDWDHFVPQEAGAQMKVHEGHNKRSVNHPDRRMLHRIGNLWVLPASKNRSLGKKSGSVKHEMLQKWSDAGTAKDGRRHLWPREQWSFTEAEIEDFCTVVELLGDADGSNDEKDAVVNEAMREFKETVEARGRRLLAEAFARYQRLREFGLQVETVESGV